VSGYANLGLIIDGHTAVVTLANPPANTFTRDSLSALAQLVADMGRRGDIFALVVTGAGPKFFSAGADLKQFAAGDRAVAHDTARRFGQAFEALTAFPGVTIAAINGYAMGGGLECALACDFRIAEEQAQMALPEASVGLLPCAGGTQALTRLAGEGWAKRLILLGERIDAATGLRIGLVEEVVPSGKGLETALEWAARAVRQSPMAVRLSKQLIQGPRSESQAAGLVREREYFVDLFGTADQQEGVKAFLEKRPPEWRNA
jgi:enoyl-CoA hydratase/carnithine racemase